MSYSVSTAQRTNHLLPLYSFPSPKIFTNALLAPHDITALIRDTEPHERALFSVPPPPPPSTSQAYYADPKASTSRRQTVFNVTSGEIVASANATSRVPRRNTAVAAVLGADLNTEIRRNENQPKGEMDVEVLLRGAEKLGDVYVLDGAKEKIAALRQRNTRIKSSLAHYEAKVARQARELEKMNRPGDWEGDSEDDEEGAAEGTAYEEEVMVTDEDLRREEEEIRELEKKKKELEDRVSGMERDLGGLLR